MISKTTKLTHSWLDRLALPPAFVVALVVILVAAGISALSRLDLHERAAAVPTPALPVILIATVAPTSAPLPSPEPVVQIATVRYVTAWAAPNGDVLGPIPAPRLSDVLARYGDAWVMVPWEAGQVWVRAADVGLPNVADIRPTPPPAVIYVAAQPAQAAPAPAYEPASAPAVIDAAPAPAAAPTSAPVVRASDFKEPDHAATCAFIGCLP